MKKTKEFLFDSSAIVASVLLIFFIICLSFSAGFKEVLSVGKTYLEALQNGNLGTDANGREILPQLLFHLPRTLLLALGAFVLCAVLGITAGMLFSFRSRKRNHTFHILLTSAVLSLPDILIILLLQVLMVFLHTHGLPSLPISGCTSLVSVVLPAISLSLIPAFFLARITYTHAMAAYAEKFIVTARAKGCSEREILMKHVWVRIRPAVVKSLYSLLPLLVSNLLVVEWLFNYAGLSFSLYKTLDSGKDLLLFTGWLLALAFVYLILAASIRVMEFIAAGGRSK